MVKMFGVLAAVMKLLQLSKKDCLRLMYVCAYWAIFKEVAHLPV